MLNIVYLGRMKKDMKVCQKRHYDFSFFKDVVDTLRIPEILPQKNKPHPLTGDYSGYDECHITPDWLLIYKQTDTDLFLARTGTHSDLFG
jgi:mRNA interferase YafQ